MSILHEVLVLRSVLRGLKRWTRFGASRQDHKGAGSVTEGEDSFELIIAPGYQVRKARAGQTVTAQPEALFPGGVRLYGVRLARGEAIETPQLKLTHEHALYLAVAPLANATAPARVCIDCRRHGAERWMMLASVQAGGATSGLQRVRLDLSAFEGVCQFRLSLDEAERQACLVSLLRICPFHLSGRLNALNAYAFRLSNEVQHFSGSVYTHSMYGPQTEATEQRGIVDVATVGPEPDQERRRARLRHQASELLEQISPSPGEAVFSYATRALSALLPMAAPNFFARASELSAKKPLRILSILAGAARVEEQILNHCSGLVEFTFLDASSDLMQRAADRLCTARPGLRVHCLVGDINSGLPAQGDFDVIICVSGLHHVADLERVLSEVNHRLTDQGEFWSIGEQIGRNGNRLWPDAYEAANSAFMALPPRLRKNAHTGVVDETLSDQDFSIGSFEGIRSEELDTLLERHFIPGTVYKRNAFLWRLVDATYGDNFDLTQPEDLGYLRAIIAAEAVHWISGGRSTELHGIYRKKRLNR